MYRGLSHDNHHFESSASAPSMRASGYIDPATSMGDAQDEAGNIKVVVRCRAFVQREKDRNADCLIRMDPDTQMTTLFPPVPDSRHNARGKIYEEKSFTFDKSFWSHDTHDEHYATQEAVYHSFGEEFLDHNFDGYHTCIFAYGQTGSGKSYTMMGTPDNPGLIPRTCEALFSRIEDEPSPNTTYNVHVSYFEVYNEHVRDLLVPRTDPPYYLKIRESTTDGVYVQGLTDQPVRSYKDVTRLMRMGDVNRTTAATKMNDTSSRSHAVFTIMLKQIQHDLLSDETIERCARMRLVDLAGSERPKSTEATGARLAEGGKINKSLSTLGRVIAALADPARQTPGRSRKPKEVVPYRDSVLTWLLKDSLGGNSKTAMVACISPTDYDETLSTLRYADQAKRIRTRATVNQDAITTAERDAQISAMAEQIRLLQTSMTAASVRRREEATELEDYQKQVEKMQRLMEETKMVSESKIRGLTAEVEELAPECLRLRDENEALRRHLALVVGELRNPIRLPEMAKPFDLESLDLDSEAGSLSEKDDERSGEDEMEGKKSPHPAIVDEDETEESAIDVQEEARRLLDELGTLRIKMKDDYGRFSAGTEAKTPLREGR
ncbi:kinesin-domain-containing protein [Patellaria atrata CBS 101060]|uniref:Kinesin-like protein n=1 Tax=Patellaria atrata CBS 101060 TaxID=1346257 RepID=A0A9P4S5F4_9PEZI|nr:kinesin-domain-containing protein [Patellaria atrata CBS 101060]